ncbi:F0F1-ATPase subunit family protein [Frankia sp. AgPm24]|uniref:F0F1-ATPase subunit family protein n=1 Tax=Frankia umida TaxID=573489 RepID=A0ABT0JWC8_9ACTN|nr:MULTISPECIES: F0F1-ATPase subunit family protein [Frankia]MCK9875855.1 F0F1-ATPase subunit family protein [Frankia umida]MCK9924155.1 F0F1-ATPase subunit family protein [Frankia sp. AgPm24]
MAAGLGFWGAVGFGADRLLGFDGLFLPIGLAIGIGAAMYLVIYRLTRR